MSFRFLSNTGRNLNYAEAGEVVRHLLAEHLGVAPRRLTFLMVDVSDILYTKTYFYCTLDGKDPSPDVDEKIRRFVRELGFGRLGMEDVVSV